jgi:ribosomal protein S18 acetylase RimI-like enzyme
VSVTGGATGEDVELRHATEDDQPRIVGLVDEWFSGQRVRHLVGRSWFRHFGSTSWLAVDGGGHPIGFLIGYRSPDRPTEAVVHLVGVDPNRRRRGIGGALIEAFVADSERIDVGTITAVAWPGEPPATAFFRALGFRPDDGPGTRNLFGTTAYPDYDGAGEDRIVFVLQLPTDRTHGVAASDA